MSWSSGPLISADFRNHLKKCGRPALYNHRAYLPVFLRGPGMDTQRHSCKHWNPLAGAAGGGVSSPRALFLLTTSHPLPLTKTTRGGKQGGDTHRGRGRSLNESHMFPPRGGSPGGPQPRTGRWEGRWSTAQLLTAPRCTFSRTFFAHTLLCTPSTWIHLAQLWHHRAQFTPLFLFFGQHRSSRSSLLQRNPKGF